MSITISDVTPRVQYTAANTQTTFAVGFEFFTNADLKVFAGNTQLTFAATPANAGQYSVAGAGVSGGGSITLGGASTNGVIYTIFRDMAVARSTDFPTSGAFQIGSLNTELDKIIAMIQQVERDLKFSPKAAATTANTFNLTFPNLIANKILSVNSSGTALEFATSNVDVTTVAGIASDISALSAIASDIAAVENIKSAIASVADDATDIGAVAAKATEIGRLGTSDAVTDMNTLGTSAIVTDMDLLATSANVTAMGNLGTSANVTAMGLLGTSTVVTDLGILGTAAIVEDLAILGTTAVVADMEILSASTVIADMAILATSDIVADMAILGTNDVVADMAILATNDVVTDMNTLGTAAIVEDMGILGTSANVTAMGLLGTAAVVEDMGILGTSANVTAIANVSSNLNSVSNFEDQYKISANAPSNPNEGDLWYDSTNNVLKIYNGSNFVAVTSATAGISNVADDNSPQLGGNLDVVTHSLVSTSNRNIAITPNGSGKVILDGLSHPTADGSAGQALVTNGSGVLSFATPSSAEVYGFEKYFRGSTLVKTVTVVSVSGANKYFIDGVQQDTLDLEEGNTYIFNYPSAHPFKFSTTSNGSHASGSQYTTGVTHNSSSQLTIVVAANAPTLYYYCSSHSGMGGTANTPTPALNDMRVITTNKGADNITENQYANFDDVLFSASGFVFSISNGNLISTI